MSFTIDFAPLQSITDAPYRRAHAECFGGIRKYLMPFISPTQHTNLTNKERRDVDPAENAGVPAVPQILAKNAEHFLFAARYLADLGWEEVNLNAGCPAGTVTAKGKGAGLLTGLAALECFLDDVYAGAPVPVSVKTRLGWENQEEFPALLELLNRYPVKELIVHARTRKEFYGGKARPDVFLVAARDAKMPLVYNGDLFSEGAVCTFREKAPDCRAVMIGRGLISNPALARTLAGGPPLAAGELETFYERLYDEYAGRFSETALLGRMREHAKYLCCPFEDARKAMKAICKAGTAARCREAIRDLFRSHALREDPGFVPDGSRAGRAAPWQP